MSGEDYLRTKDMLMRALINIEEKMIDRRAFLLDKYEKDPAATDDWEQNLVMYRDLQDNDPVLQELKYLYRMTRILFSKAIDKDNGKYLNPRHPALMAWAMLRRK